MKLEKDMILVRGVAPGITVAIRFLRIYIYMSFGMAKGSLANMLNAHTADDILCCRNFQNDFIKFSEFNHAWRNNWLRIIHIHVTHTHTHIANILPRAPFIMKRAGAHQFSTNFNETFNIHWQTFTLLMISYWNMHPRQITNTHFVMHKIANEPINIDWS